MKKSMISAVVTGLFLVGSLAAESKVNQRRENQQDRIAQGVKSGQLTAGETARLEKKEARVNREIHADRKANGGNLTNNEKRQINRQQNRMSKDIYKQKHDGQTQ